jgi:predicted nuclease of restriction endonuclease-like (RecB) superfamily
MKTKPKRSAVPGPVRSGAEEERLFSEVAEILEEARRQTVRSVNTYMVKAYWLIGWRIVVAEQGGKARAGYGKRLIENLSQKLTERFGRGFSVQSLWNFRTFFLTYRDRGSTILSPPGRESDSDVSKSAILSPLGRESESADVSAVKSRPGEDAYLQGFHPNLSWSHYRALMRVERPEAREFYEQEAVKAGWSKRDLERQIDSLYYERLLMSRNKQGLLTKNRQKGLPVHPLEVIKDPYVLEFLNLPESHTLSETALETRLISHLQEFLLELGHGFAFIGRQQRLTLDGDHFYADLVFYHVRLKCYIIIDLKTGRLSHADLGQMLLYVNYYDREIAGPDDGPTLGLILCTSKNDAVVRYVLGKDQEKIFASRYRLVLPTEDELAAEMRKELAALEMETKAEGVNHL